MADNKMAIYADVGAYGEIRLLIGHATVKNGTICFDREDFRPAVLTPRDDLIDASIEIKEKNQ